jgi:hypothetical protein
MKLPKKAIAWFRKESKSSGAFRILFPIIILTLGVSIGLFVSWVNGFDVIGWLAGPHAVLLYLSFAAVVCLIVGFGLGAGKSK